MRFFGLVFIISTTLILIFKEEKNFYHDESLENNLSIKQTFNLLSKILKLDSIKNLLFILFTSKVNQTIFNYLSIKQYLTRWLLLHLQLEY